MKYAEVAVNSPGGHLHSFSYSIPQSMELEVGQAVWVPFGPRTVQGIVIRISDSSTYPETRGIIGLISSRVIVDPYRIELSKWIAEHYLSPLFDAVALMLPPGFERRVITTIRLTEKCLTEDRLQDTNDFIAYIKGKGGETDIRDLQKSFGKIQSAYLIRNLLADKKIEKTYDIEPEKIKPKIIDCLALNRSFNKAEYMTGGINPTKLARQVEILEFLRANGGIFPLAEMRKVKDFRRSVINQLLTQELVSVVKVSKKRDPLAGRVLPLEFPLSFTDEQQSAWHAIKQVIAGDNQNDKTREFLLHGVTGSGKTEIYLKALAESIKRGKKGICLVPEIALTPQMIERFYARFPGRVAVLHSRLSIGEQYDQWYSIYRGEYDVVIGSRSAVFAPQPNLGLIIVDEEHEWAYKQSAPVPRYHARDVARKLAELNEAVLILGSATPDVQTYYRALSGQYRIIELKERVSSSGISQLPEVTVIDMKTELKAGNRGLFSRLLKSQLSSTLEKNEQAILYINRRGRATFIECGICGYIFSCKRCSSPLTYHASDRRLICHHCSRSYQISTFCPECSGSKIKYLGTGTERVEEECIKLFPDARIIRFDSDSISNYRDYERIVKIFRNREADVLIGTQMLAKGFDFPLVTLVGVVNADIGLSLPDFRAAERTFQLLCQVSGRAGRGIVSGKSIIQTYNPSHYAIKYAGAQDYAGFYQREIEYRHNFDYPPFSRMIRMVYNHSDRAKCWRESESMADKIKLKIREKGISDIKIIGPVYAYIERLRGKYQVQIILFGQEITGLIQGIEIPNGWILDVDPLGVV